jgi:hypothetical protein
MLGDCAEYIPAAEPWDPVLLSEHAVEVAPAEVGWVPRRWSSFERICDLGPLFICISNRFSEAAAVLSMDCASRQAGRLTVALARAPSGWLVRSMVIRGPGSPGGP